MEGTVTVGGLRTPATTAGVTELVTSGTPFWLDLEGVDAEASALLDDTLHLHPLAVEDAEHFGQRPKIDEFDEFTYFVVHGAVMDTFATSELHVFLMAHSIVTVHHDECPAIE